MLRPFEGEEATEMMQLRAEKRIGPPTRQNQAIPEQIRHAPRLVAARDHPARGPIGFRTAARGLAGLELVQPYEGQTFLYAATRPLQSDAGDRSCFCRWRWISGSRATSPFQSNNGSELKS